MEQAAHGLDQARRDAALAARLEAIRLKRATHVEGYFNSASERRFTNARADQDYEQAFRQAGFEEVGTDPAAAAARVRQSVVPQALLAGLTDWAVCAVAPDRQDWLLAVARQADPGAWSNRVRDPAAWRDGAGLAALARATPVTQQATPLLLALAERLQATGGDAIALVQQVRREHPDDFWVNFASGKVLREEGKPEEAVACYRKALQIRPEAAVVNNLGLALYDAHVRAGDGIWDEAIDCYQKILDQDRRSAPAHNNLGVVLKVRGDKGDWDKAEEHFRLATSSIPGRHRPIATSASSGPSGATWPRRPNTSGQPCGSIPGVPWLTTTSASFSSARTVLIPLTTPTSGPFATTQRTGTSMTRFFMWLIPTPSNTTNGPSSSTPGGP